MPRYAINKRYSAMYNATRLDYTAGAEVDLPEAQADWVNRDCPGTLSLIEPEPELAADESETTDASADETAVDDTADAETASDDVEAGAEEQAKPARNRAHTPARTRK